MKQPQRADESIIASVEVGRLLYYQKPAIGQSSQDPNAELNTHPIQIVFPSGTFGVGIPISSKSENRDDTTNIGAIMSIPEDDPVDKFYRRGIVAIFLVSFIVNIVITGLLYANATTADQSKAEKVSGIAFTFGEVAPHRTSRENMSFALTIIILLIGASGSILENPTLLSIFSYGVLMNFILGTQALPYYLYSFRYALDFFMLYVALVLRLKCNVVFLPIHIHGS